MRIKKKYGNQLNYIVNRITAKDAAEILGVSTSSILHYRKKGRGVPEHLKNKITALKESLPKAKTKKKKLLARRAEKIKSRNTLKLKHYDSSEYGTRSWVYLYQGLLRDIGTESKVLFNKHISYGQTGVARIIKKVTIDGNVLFDSTHNINIKMDRGVDKLKNEVARMMNKYQDIMLEGKNITFEFSIIITLFL